MGFLNAVGRVSRHGQWRFRETFRVADATGRADPTDAGLILFDSCTDVVLTVTLRPPFRICDPRLAGVGFDGHGGLTPVLTASLAAGTLKALPGLIEVLFPDGWGRSVAPGLYDLRIAMTIPPETAVIFDEPVAFV